ncbi:MAG: hypothetical protein U0414_38225 [Polyangiaceae bacterium]
MNTKKPLLALFPLALIAVPCVALAGAGEFEPIGGGSQACVDAKKALTNALNDYLAEYNAWDVRCNQGSKPSNTSHCRQQLAKALNLRYDMCLAASEADAQCGTGTANRQAVGCGGS